jgi:hypothetical protein
MATETTLTAESRQRLEQQWAEATAAARRAEQVHQDLSAANDEGETLMSAACLALWRAQERQRALEYYLHRARS